MSEIVLLAFFKFATALLDVIKIAMEGQTPAQREKMWEWYVTDIGRIRKWLKLDDAPQPTMGTSAGNAIRWVASGKSRVRNNRVR